MAKKTKKKIRRKLSKNVAADRLLRAVGNWVAANGGSAVVAGGIGILHQPTDLNYQFTVCVKVTGRPPESRIDTQGAQG